MSRKKAAKKTGRSWRGSQMAELGPTLFIVFIVIGFPMIAFSAIGIRYGFLAYAARLAAAQGALSKTFSANTSSSDLSAKNMAANILNNFTLLSLSGTTPPTNGSGANYYIVVTPLAGGSVTRYSSPLSSPANSSTNSYNFEVVVYSLIPPLFPSGSWFGTSSNGIPGLTAPIPTQARADVFFENTQGLNQ
jgi:hypothetical protein